MSVIRHDGRGEKSARGLRSASLPAWDAFVEEEGFGGEAGEIWLAADLQLQVAQFLASTFTFAARERDVRMVGTCLRNETAERGGGGDGLL